MTVYEIIQQEHHRICECALGRLEMINRLQPDSDMMPLNIRLFQEWVDSAYALGLVLDDMAIELAEREI